MTGIGNSIDDNIKKQIIKTKKKVEWCKREKSDIKTLSWVWGWDRPEDHRLASRELLNDIKRWSGGPNFLSHPPTNNGCFFSLAIDFLF